jgi:hypothetical protein
MFFFRAGSKILNTALIQFADVKEDSIDLFFQGHPDPITLTDPAEVHGVIQQMTPAMFARQMTEAAELSAEAISKKRR